MQRFFFYIFTCIFYTSLFSQTSLSSEKFPKAKQTDEAVYLNKILDTANLYFNADNYKKAVEYNIKLLNTSLLYNNHYFTYLSYRNLGHNYLALKDTVLVKENFQKAERYAKLAQNDTAVALSYMDLARLNSNEGKFSTAFNYHEKSILLFEKFKDSSNLAIAHYNAALTALAAEDYNNMYLHILKAKKYHTVTESGTFNIRLDGLMGWYYFGKEDDVTANKYFEIAIRAAERENFPVLLEKLYGEYAKALSKQGKFEEAFVMLEERQKMLQKNMEKESSEKSGSIAANFQISEYRKNAKEAQLQNQLQAEIVKNKSRLNNFLIVIATCFLLMAIALFIAYLKRRQLVDQLKIKNKEYLEAKEYSEKLSKAKTNFFSTVSHELRTPLYGVIGLSTILLEDENLKKHEKDLKSLKFSADYLLALINDVLQINKIDSKSIENEMCSFNIRELLGKLVSSFEYMRLQNKNTITVEISEDTPSFLHGNSVRLSQILMNLIGNACKFTENGTITIHVQLLSIKKGKAKLLFKIKDTGIGIPYEKQEIIFDEFAQANSVNYNYQGTGLGLPIVKKLLALSDATISLESEPDKGSTFSFTLLYDIVDKMEVKEELPLLDTKLLCNKKILVAEDNRINQTVTKKILEKNHVHCTIVQNGEEAIQHVAENYYDLILMDINMPTMNGIDAASAIRKFNKKVPIVALTAVEVEEVRSKIFNAGMNDIIVKPYDVSKFIQTILLNISLRTNEREHPITYL